MKTAYKWFDIFLNLLLFVVVLAGATIFVLGYNGYNFPPNSITSKGVVFTVILLISFIFGLLYIIIGIGLLIANRKLKNVERFKLGKRMLLKGIIRSVLTFVLFFLLSLALSFFGISGGSTNDLPVILDPNTPGFPVSDLKVTDRKLISPQSAGDSWYCDVTVQNNNTTQTAVTFTFNKAEVYTDDDSIPPGQTKIIRIYGKTTDITNPCKNVSIAAAEILNPDPSTSPSISPGLSQ